MTLALALVMAFGAFAQKNVLSDGKRSIESFDLENATKHEISQAKAMAVEIEIGEIGALEVEVTVTPNDEVVEWHYLAGCTSDPNSDLSQYIALTAMFGMTLEDAIITFSDNEGVAMTGTQTVTMGYKEWMVPGVTNTVYVVAVDANQNVQLFQQDFVADVLGGEGTAEIAINIPTDSVTTTSYYIEFTPNDQTSNWHYIMLDETTKTALQWTEDSVLAYIDTFEGINEEVSAGGMLQGISTTLTGNPGETYHWYAVAYNLNEEPSELAYASVTLDAIGGTGTPAVNVVVSNIGPYTADVVMTPNDQTSYYYYLIITDEEMAAAGLASDDDVKAYLEANSEKSFFELGGQLQGLTQGTTYKIYAIAYNLNGESSSSAPVTTFTTETAGGSGLAEVELIVEVVNGLANVSSVMNDQTAYMYYGVFDTNENTNQEILDFIDGNPDMMVLEDVEETYQLEAGVGYGAFAIPYNGNNEEGTSVAIKFNIDGLVSLADVAASSLSLFPNPANTQVTVSSQSAIDRVEIVNMLGQKVYENANVGGNQATINVAGLENGTYIVRIVSAKNNKTSKLIVR